jgi:hypothetical protein
MQDSSGLKALIHRAHQPVLHHSGLQVSDVEVHEEYQFERWMFGSNPEQLRSLAAWLLEQEVEEAVMESTAQYWKPVWEAEARRRRPDVGNATSGASAIEPRAART